MQRIPVHIVTGAPGSGKSALIAKFVREREGWLGLVNALPDAAGGESNLRLFSAGCPCCTGRVVLQVALVRALRESGATRAFVELLDAGHAAALQKLLEADPLARSVRPARGVILPRDAELPPGAIGA